MLSEVDDVLNDATVAFENCFILSLPIQARFVLVFWISLDAINIYLQLDKLVRFNRDSCCFLAVLESNIFVRV